MLYLMVVALSAKASSDVLARSVYDRGWGPWLFVVALVIALAWVPVLIRFFRSWQARKNPISLAICILVTLAVYLPAYATLAVPPSWPLATFLTIDSISCGSFYAAFWWTKKYFKETRAN